MTKPIIKYTKENKWGYTSVTQDCYTLNIIQQEIVEYVYNKTFPTTDAMRIALKDSKQWKHCVNRDIKEAAEIACLQNESVVWSQDETTQVAYVEVDEISDFWQGKYDSFLKELK